MKKLQVYQWPGNIRELKNTIERAMILNSGNVLHIQTPELGQSDGLLDMTMEEMQKNHIKNILEKTGGKIRGKNGAAELLGMKPSTLESRMKKLGVKRRE
jgi:DNA-binding NtrC family response regulator